MRKIVYFMVLLFCIFNSIAGAQERIVIGDGVVGCKNKEYYQEMSDYAAQNNRQALHQKLAAGILTGNCAYFNNGESVVVLDTAPVSGLIKVQKKGSAIEYWTTMAAVQ